MSVARLTGLTLVTALSFAAAGCDPFAPVLRDECKQFIEREVAARHPGGTISGQRQTAWSKLDRPRPGYNAEVGDVLFTNVELTVRVGDERTPYRVYCPNTSAFPQQKHKIEAIAKR